MILFHIRKIFRHKWRVVSKGASNNRWFKSAALLPSTYCCSLLLPRAFHSLVSDTKRNLSLESAARVSLQIEQDSKAPLRAACEVRCLCHRLSWALQGLPVPRTELLSHWSQCSKWQAGIIVFSTSSKDEISYQMHKHTKSWGFTCRQNPVLLRWS